MSAPRLAVEAVPELTSVWWQGFSPVLALTDCRYFHDLWAHLMPIFYHRIWNCNFSLGVGGNTCYHLFCWKAPVCVNIFFSHLIRTFFAKWILFFLKRVHAVWITPLDKKALQYQWNTATSGQKPGKQVKQSRSEVCFLNIRKTNSSAQKDLHHSTFWYPVFQAFLSGRKRMYGRAFCMIQMVFCNTDLSLGSLAVLKTSA